ncbi:MAG: serine/threonine-protein kinase [Myxococcota bacterium]
MTNKGDTVPDEDAFFEGVARARPTEDFEDARVRDHVAAGLFGHERSAARIDRFTLIEQIGSGGAGVVYAAYDPRLDRKVAIKVLHGEMGGDRAAASQRLIREAKAAGRLSHPNVVNVFDVGEWNGRVYLAMEFVPGPNLAHWLREGDHDHPAILSVFKAAGRGLAAAHRAGIVHRDFKPGNVIVTEDPVEGLRARVADFGLARLEGTATDVELDGSPAGDFDGQSALTQPGQRMGTPAYMAPEQFFGEPTDARTDQFSFCVALYEALVGSRPFDGQGSFEVTDATLDKLPAALVRPIACGLSEVPSARFDGMETLLGALEPAAPRRRTLWGLGALGVAALGAAVAWAGYDADRCDFPQGLPGWSEAREGELAAAFAASAVAGAEDTWQRVGPALAEHAETWAATRVSVCRARHRRALSSSLHDHALACLSRQALSFEALTSHLETPSAATVHGAVVAVSELDPGACGDPTRLVDRLALPTDAGEAAAVANARALTDRASVASGLADYERALALLDEADAVARSVSFPALDAELSALRGGLLVTLGRDDEAADALGRAYRLGEELDYDRVRLVAAVERATQLSVRDPSQAQVWAEVGTAVAIRSEPRGLGHMQALLAAAAVAFEQGDYRRSWKHAEDAGAIVEATYSERDDLRGRARYTAAQAAVRAGDLEAAAGLADEARQALAKGLGPRHPRVAVADFMVGNIARDREQFVAARVAYDAALTIFTDTLGAGNDKVAAVRNGLAILAEMQEDFDAAEAQYRLVLQLMKDNHGPRAIRVAAVYDNLGVVHARRGDLEEAEALFREALSIGVERLGADHPEVATSFSNLGSVLIDRGQLAAALPYLSKALAVREHALGPDHPAHLSVLDSLAHAELGLGRGEAALPWASRAVDIVREKLGPHSTRMVGPLSTRGRVYVELGRPGDAQADFEHAIEIGSADPEVGRSYELASAHLALARLLVQSPRRRESARRHARAARKLLASMASGPAVTAKLEAVDALLGDRAAPDAPLAE